MPDAPLFEIRRLPPDEQMIRLSDAYMKHVGQIATLESERAGYIERSVQLENTLDRILTERMQLTNAVRHLYQHLTMRPLSQDCESIHPFMRELLK